MPGEPWYAGVHLSGSNAQRTAVVALSGNPLIQSLKVARVYEKIGSFGSLFSDDRLVDILAHMPLGGSVFIDCPLSLPPCVACTRPSCPGVVKCDDVSVAYMLSLSGRAKSRRAQKHRPLNPQSQRLWDAYQLVRGEVRPGEATFSSNLAPLVTRARVLQRRLNSLEKPVQLAETSVALALDAVAHLIGADTQLGVDYRSFETGLDTRFQVLDEMVQRGWIERPDDPNVEDQLVYTVEGFNAFITAWVASLHGAALTDRRPGDFVQDEGWVFRPLLDVPVTRLS